MLEQSRPIFVLMHLIKIDMRHTMRIKKFDQLLQYVILKPQIVKRDIQHVIDIVESLLNMLHQHSGLTDTTRTFYTY